MMPNFPCLNCYKCKTSVFTSVYKLEVFCAARSIKSNQSWISSIINVGRVRLIWCEIQTAAHKKHGFSPRAATPKYSVNKMDLSTADEKEITVTTTNNQTFIEGCLLYKEV